jgi:hypothetical protein
MRIKSNQTDFLLCRMHDVVVKEQYNRYGNDQHTTLHLLSIPHSLLTRTLELGGATLENTIESTVS